jgi:cell wall-associated NlpC family hydrolase
MVLGASDWGEVVSGSEYAESIQNRDEAVIRRVTALREQIQRSVKRMKAQEVKLEAARDEIADEQRAAIAARDEVEAQRAEFLATRDMREARIAALQDRAGTIEGNLPDLTLDPASSSAPQAPAPSSGQTAVLGPDGLASAPIGAPQAVKDVIAAANSIVGTPYVWGGGHGSFESSGYDCSGAVSFALHGGGLLTSPLDSTGLTVWGEPGEGNWISVYGNSGHVYAVIAGLRWDTSDTGGTGPKWHTDLRDNSGFIPRHPSGL